MDQAPALLGTLQKLPLFQDLSPSQLKLLFKLCSQESYQRDEMLCRAGGDSDRMFILLAGTVEVRTEKGMALVQETAVTTIGEAGMLTGEQRSASVVAVAPVTALAIQRRPLMRLMQQDATMAIQLYRNVLLMVRQKLIAADRRIEQMV